MTYSFYDGGLSSNYIIAVEKQTGEVMNKLAITLDNGTTVNAVEYQDFFDMDAKRYFEINAGNYTNAVGKCIMVLNGNEIGRATIESIVLTREVVDAYELITARDYNFFADNVMSCEPNIFCVNAFEITDEYKYDEAKYQADLDRYGMYTYDEYAWPMTEEEFNMFNGPIFKVAVGKGLITEEYILAAIMKYYSDYLGQ